MPSPVCLPVCLSIYLYTFSLPLFLLMSLSSYLWASLIAQSVNNLPAMQETQVRFLGQADPLEKEMATHSSTLA